MKYINSFPLLESSSLTPDQIRFLNRHNIEGKWEFDPSTGIVNVNGNFSCSGFRLTSFRGIRFGTVTGKFDCSENKLTSLEGAPKEVGGGFYCGYNELTSLEGSPKEVSGDFICRNNNLTTLEGAPKEVGGYFICRNNSLTTLEGAPKEVGGYFSCDEFSIEGGEWGPEGWMKVFRTGSQRAKDLVLTIIGAEELNREIEKDPEGMMMELRRVWNSPDFASMRSKIQIPSKYKEEMNTLGDLSALGF
jgi:hypothetical protein